MFVFVCGKIAIAYGLHELSSFQ